MRHIVAATVLAVLLRAGNPALAADMAGITDGGAKCDGTTDDTAAINAYLAGFKAGAVVHVPPDRLCLIASGNLVVPDNVIITGDAAPWRRRSDQPGGSGFLLGPAHTIAMHQHTGLRDIVVLRAGLVRDPTDAQVIEAVEAWGKETSNAITLNGDGIRLEHLFIEGFNTAIYDYGWGTFIISDVMGDTYNGMFVTAAGDNMSILDVRFEPFYAIGSPNAHVGVQAHIAAAQAAGTRLRFAANALNTVQAGDYAAILSGPHAGVIPPGTKVVTVDPKASEAVLSQAPTTALAAGDAISFGGSWARPGVSFTFQGNGGNTTGWYCQRCFSFMYRHGALIDGSGVGTMTDADFEYQHAFDPGTDGSGTFGIRLAGGSSGISIAQSSVGGQTLPFIDDMAPAHAVQLANVRFGYPDFIITAGTGGPKGVAGAWFSGRTGEPVVVTLTGAAGGGAEQALIVNGRTVAYTPPGPAARVLSAWARALNSDPALIAQHVVAYWSANDLALFAPAGLALDVIPRVSGPLTASLKKGAASPGAWGNVNGFVYDGPPRLPAVVVGPHDDLALTFADFSGDNAGNLPPGAFAIDPTSSRVQFLTYPAGSAGNNTLSACGKGATLAPGSTALRGTITEGAGAAGCTLTFPTAFPRTPVCLVSSPTGSAIAGYAVTERALTIRNPGGAGNEYAFICSP
jgi:hypothetical protein